MIYSRIFRKNMVNMWSDSIFWHEIVRGKCLLEEWNGVLAFVFVSADSPFIRDRFLLHLLSLFKAPPSLYFSSSATEIYRRKTGLWGENKNERKVRNFRRKWIFEGELSKSCFFFFNTKKYTQMLNVLRNLGLLQFSEVQKATFWELGFPPKFGFDIGTRGNPIDCVACIQPPPISKLTFLLTFSSSSSTVLVEKEFKRSHLALASRVLERPNGPPIRPSLIPDKGLAYVTIAGQIFKSIQYATSATATTIIIRRAVSPWAVAGQIRGVTNDGFKAWLEFDWDTRMRWDEIVCRPFWMQPQGLNNVRHLSSL